MERRFVEGYTTVMKAVHWTTAATIIALLLIGWSMTGLPLPPAMRGELYALHKSLGVFVLVLTLFRMLWRLGHPSPPLPPTLRPWEIAAVHAVHRLFYLLLLVQPLVGWALYSLAPYKSLFFGLFMIPDLPFVPHPTDPARWLGALEGAHGFLAGVFAVLVLVHVGAALKHHFVARDDVLLRMTPTGLAAALRRLRGER